MNIHGAFCFLILYLGEIVSILEARSGPFKTSFTRVGPCVNPTLPLDSPPASLYYAELYNTTTDVNQMRGNMTVLRDFRMKKMKAKSYLWQNSKWKVSFVINNIGCNHVVFPVLCKASGVKYEAKTCSLIKGVYVFNSFNIDKIHHQWMNSQEYGKTLWRMEMFSNTGTVFCYDYELLIEQVK